MSQTYLWIIGGVAFYMAAMLLIGFWASKRVKDTRDYIVAGGRLGWIGAQLLAFGYILNSLTGIPLMPAVLISTAVVVRYTYSGGMWADTMTDLFQVFILLIGLLILYPILVRDIGVSHMQNLKYRRNSSISAQGALHRSIG